MEYTSILKSPGIIPQTEVNYTEGTEDFPDPIQTSSKDETERKDFPEALKTGFTEIEMKGVGQHDEIIDSCLLYITLILSKCHIKKGPVNRDPFLN